MRCWTCVNHNWFKSYDKKRKWGEKHAALLYFKSSRFTTISSHFFNNYLYIFHKTVVQMVILRCWTGRDHNWLKSYDKKRKWGEKDAVLTVQVRFRLYHFIFVFILRKGYLKKKLFLVLPFCKCLVRFKLTQKVQICA